MPRRPRAKRATAPSLRAPRTARGVAKVPAVAEAKGRVKAPFKLMREVPAVAAPVPKKMALAMPKRATLRKRIINCLVFI